MMIQFRFISLLFCLVLAACGGGSGGSGSGSVQPSTVTLPSGPAVTVQGNIKYERVAVNSSGSLNYSSISQLPVRGATVELLFGNTVLATTQSSATGQFVFTTATGSSTLSIRVRAELKQSSGAAQWDVTVRDNTNADALYVLSSSTFNSGTGSTQNLIATSGWTGFSYTGARTAGPFSILDTIYDSQQKVLQASPSTVFPVLQTFWSINNSTSDGDLTLGNIGTSFFQDTPSRKLYILGRQDDDTDEYDASVVAHEWGHYYQSAFSRDDSMGGAHGGSDDRLDRRVAFSEGWGNAWAGIALSQNRYRDSYGSSQATGFALILDSGYSGIAPKGWFREGSIQYILWDLNRQTGFAPLHAALTSNAFKTGVPLSDIHAFSAAFRSVASVSQTAALNALLSAETINNTSDSFGNNEANNGGSAVTLPYYRQVTALGNLVTLSAGQTVCVTAAYAGTSDANKLGQYAYVRFTTPSTGNRSISVSSSTSGVDTDFEVHSAGARVLLADTGVTNSESASVNLSAGEHVLVIYDYNLVAGTPCFNISIQ